MHPSIWKLIPLLMKEEIIVKKENMNKERTQQAEKKYKTLWTKDLGDKYLSTTHKVKSVIYAILDLHTF